MFCKIQNSDTAFFPRPQVGQVLLLGHLCPMKPFCQRQVSHDFLFPFVSPSGSLLDKKFANSLEYLQFSEV